MGRESFTKTGPLMSAPPCNFLSSQLVYAKKKKEKRTQMSSAAESGGWRGAGRVGGVQGRESVVCF